MNQAGLGDEAPAVVGMGGEVQQRRSNGGPGRVDPGEEQPANAVLALSNNVAMVVGPAVAGVLVAWLGPGGAVAVDAATFGVSAVTLAVMRPRPYTPTATEGIRAEIAGGWREVRSRTWVWATLIALADGDEVVVGLVSAPALGRRWWAAKGTGAWTGKSLAAATRLQVSGVSTWADASFAYASLDGWEERGVLEPFLDLLRGAWRTRGYGDFWSYMLVAEGAVDVACEPELAVHDMAALVPIVTEAGGRFTSLDGAPGPWGGNAVATNSALHDEVLRLLSA